MLLLTIFFVRYYGSMVPYWDDWNLVPVVTGEQPLSVSWLWAQYNEHRFPLPKLILVSALKFSGADFRVGMYLNVLALGGLALGFILAARAVRGKTKCSDAFFPIVLLHWGHADSFLWTMVNTYVTPTVLVGLLLIVIVRCRGQLSPVTAGLFGLGLLGLSLSGANGLVYVPALATWLAWAGLRRWRNGAGWPGRGAAVVALVGSASALSVLGLYFIGFQHKSFSDLSHRSTSGSWDVFQGIVMFLAMNFGAAARRHWRELGLLLGALVLVCGVLLAAAIRRNRSSEIVRDLGLLAFLTGCLLLALAVAWGRSIEPRSLLLGGRYASMAVPLLCGIYFIWEINGPARVRSWGRAGLFILVLTLVPLNWTLGHALARQTTVMRKALDRDLQSRMPVYLLVKRNKRLFPFHDVMQNCLLSLRRAGFSGYRNVGDNPPFREVALPLVATATHEVDWRSGSGFATGDEPHLIFDLPEPTLVCGIRVRCRVRNEQGSSPFFQVAWRERGRQDFTAERKYVHWMLPPDGDGVVLCWTDARIDQIRIRPDNQRCEFSIQEITLLVTTPPSLAPPTDKKPVAKAEHPDGPYRAFGRVTDQQGQPFPGVEVWALCGVGTLKRSATAISDKDGRYELNFGRFWNKTVSAAVISPHKSGYYVEANLNRHGSYLSAPNEREMLRMKGWKDHMDRVFLPNRPLELNFVMAPAARVARKLIDAQNKPLAGHWVSLAFADNPTGSVMDTAKTDERGRFALEDISTSDRFQFTVRKGQTQRPWDDSWASAPLRFEKPEASDLKARFGTHEIRLQELQLRVMGPGVHLKTATATAATQGSLNVSAPNPSEIQERSKTRLVAKSAVLTLENSPRSDPSQSLITESLPIEPTRQ